MENKVNEEEVKAVVESTALFSDLEAKLTIDGILARHNLVLNPTIQIQLVKVKPQDSDEKVKGK